MDTCVFVHISFFYKKYIYRPCIYRPSYTIIYQQELNIFRFKNFVRIACVYIVDPCVMHVYSPVSPLHVGQLSVSFNFIAMQQDSRKPEPSDFRRLYSVNNHRQFLKFITKSISS